MKKIEWSIEEHLYHFGLDHLEVYGSIKDENFILNREVKLFLSIDFKKTEVPNYLYKLTFFKDNDVLFAYYKWNENQAVPTKDYVVIYSTGFRIKEEVDIKMFLAQFDLRRTRRFDIAGDVILPIDVVLWEFKDLSQRGATFNWKNWEVETRYIGEKQTTKNKRQLIRIYDKQVDIYSKGKVKLFADYLTQTHMTRVELEVRQELAKNVYYEDLFDVPHILSIYKNYLYKHTELFESLPGERITLFQKTIETIDPELYQSLFYKEQRRKIFIGHGKWVFNMWFCPVRVLIAEWYISEKTKLAIGIDICSIIWEMERKVVEHAKEQKKKRQEFHDVLFTD